MPPNTPEQKPIVAAPEPTASIAPAKPTPVVTSPAPAKSPVESPFVFNKANVLAKFKEQRDHLQTFVGRPGYNPFFYLKDVLLPLEEAVNKGGNSKELYNLITSLALPTDSLVAKGAEHNIVNMPKEHQAAGRVDEKLASQVASIVAHQLNPKISQ